MAVQVIFLAPQGIGPTDNAPGVGPIRAREALTIGGTTDETVQAGEIVVVYNGEADVVLVAYGSTPDAQATVATEATTAGYPIPAGQCSAPIVANTGAKINVKVVA